MEFARHRDLPRRFRGAATRLGTRRGSRIVYRYIYGEFIQCGSRVPYRMSRYFPHTFNVSDSEVRYSLLLYYVLLLIYTARPSRRTTFNMHKDYCGTESTCHALNMRQFADKGYKLDKVRTIHKQ